MNCTGAIDKQQTPSLGGTKEETAAGVYVCVMAPLWVLCAHHPIHLRGNSCVVLLDYHWLSVVWWY